MNLKKIVCELWGKTWGWCSYYWETVIICKETSLFANPDCPWQLTIRVHRDDVPTATCTIHKPPEPPLPKWKICSTSGREATRWCPETELIYKEPKLACRIHRPPDPKKSTDFIMFSYDIWRPDYTEDEWMESLTRLGKSGCNYVRTFLGWPGKGDVRLQPFLPAGTDHVPFDLYKINPEWTRLLQKFQRMMAKCGMGIMMDFYGRQVAKMESVPYAWFIGENNINNIDTYADIRLPAMTYWKWYLKQIMEIIGTKGNLVHLGNEQRAPGDGGNGNTNVREIREWCRAWAIPLANYLRDEIKVEMPISCTGEEYEGTGKGIVNELQAIGWPWMSLINHLHGLNLWEPFEKWYRPEQPDHAYSVVKHYAISDDGSELSTDNQIPVSKRGYARPDGTRYCANQFWRIDTAKRINDVLKHLRFIEWMPQCMKSDSCRPGDLHQNIDVDVYWKCAEALWNGLDIRRQL